MLESYTVVGIHFHSTASSLRSAISIISFAHPVLVIPNMSLGESENKPLSIGPFGSEGDDIWDDGVHSTVRQVVIYTDHVKGVQWIQIEYDDNGSSVWSDKHGSGYPILIAPKTYKVELDYPDEYLTSVYGYYTSNWFMPTYITKLGFRSNRRSYGPFGVEDFWGKQYFSIEEISGHKIVGFHGRLNSWPWGFWLLGALGAYLKPVDHHQNENLCHPSKPSKPLLPARYSPAQTKPKKDERPKKEISYVVSGNQVSGNEGDHNGTFVVGSNPKHIVFNL